MIRVFGNLHSVTSKRQSLKEEFRVCRVQKLSGKCHFLVQFCTSNWSETYWCFLNGKHEILSVQICQCKTFLFPIKQLCQRSHSFLFKLMETIMGEMVGSVISQGKKKVNYRIISWKFFQNLQNHVEYTSSEYAHLSRLFTINSHYLHRPHQPIFQFYFIG